jgi:hypothetical protein
MEIVLGTLEFGEIGGAATYLLTVAGQLQLLGHEVTIFAEDTGELARVAEDRGIRVVSSEEALPRECDAVYAQDAATAYLLAERYPARPQALCMHTGGSQFDRWLPPQVPGVVHAVVALTDRMEKRANALAHRVEVVRLRQPVDMARFAPRAAIRQSPREVLLLGNYLSGDRRRLVLCACQEASLNCSELGRYADRSSPTPEVEINQADIVIAHGRSILEAMACGRAAFVYDHAGGDGWVTPSNYAELEAWNFAFPTGERRVFPDQLTERLLGYRAAMGSANLDLARMHHSASRHAEELVALFERLAPGRPAEEAPLRELARMVRVQWQTETRALGAAHEARLLFSRLEAAETELAAAERRTAEADARYQALLRTPWQRLGGVLHRARGRLGAAARGRRAGRQR